MGKPFTAEEIEELIKGDTIVVAACPSQRLPALHGKFTTKTVDGEVLYCFCPFKRGLGVRFAPASDWCHGDAKDAALGIAEALMSGKRALKA